MLRYSTMDVLEPAWRTMEERVRKAADVDEVCEKRLCMRVGLYTLYTYRCVFHTMEERVRKAEDVDEVCVCVCVCVCVNRKSHMFVYGGSHA